LPEIQRPVYASDYLLPYSVEAKTEWSYISKPPYTFMTTIGKALLSFGSGRILGQYILKTVEKNPSLNVTKIL
jgi:hypothetical protein